jgi:HSP20 family protein
MATQTESPDSPTVQKSTLAARPFSFFARDPFRNFEAMRRMMDSLFEGAALPEIDHLSGPAINLYEKDGTYTIECAVPGYKKDEIKVEARSDQVLISGSYSREEDERHNQYHRRELRQGSFSRTVVLPQEIDPDQVAAKLEDGILKITLRPMKAIKSKTIPVSS